MYQVCLCARVKRNGPGFGPALVRISIPREAHRMEYRGIRYTVRTGIERGQWVVVIHPKGIEVPGNKVFGTRDDAEYCARRMIDKWLDPKSRQRARLES